MIWLYLLLAVLAWKLAHGGHPDWAGMVVMFAIGVGFAAASAFGREVRGRRRARDELRRRADEARWRERAVREDAGEFRR